MRTLDTELERDEFLKAAAATLAIDKAILLKDFGAPVKSAGAWINPPEQNRETATKNYQKPKPVGKQEKEIIALLIKFPELGDAELLLDEIPWENESAYLLYSFFHDRLKTGEAFNWENLNSAMEFLPDNLSALLAEIMMDYETAFASTSELKSEDARRHLSQLVRTLVLQALDHRIAARQKQIAETDGRGEDVEEMMLEQQQDMDKRLQWLKIR